MLILQRCPFHRSQRTEKKCGCFVHTPGPRDAIVNSSREGCFREKDEPWYGAADSFPNQVLPSGPTKYYYDHLTVDRSFHLLRSEPYSLIPPNSDPTTTFGGSFHHLCSAPLREIRLGTAKIPYNFKLALTTS